MRIVLPLGRKVSWPAWISVIATGWPMVVSLSGLPHARVDPIRWADLSARDSNDVGSSAIEASTLDWMQMTQRPAPDFTMPEETLGFAELGLQEPLVRALARGGITRAFPIQQATLPDGIAGRDLLARARTGSGKTLAYGLAALSRLHGTPPIPGCPRGLVLVPTRELAMQVIDDLSGLAEACGLRVRLVAGGMPYASQVRAIERGVHLVVATPGRLVDLIQREAIHLEQVRITVLDEADQMADMGFMPVVRQILDLTKSGGQRLLFSATLDGDVDALVRDYLNNPARHELDAPGAAVPTMDHHVLVVHPGDRQAVTEQIGARTGRTIFFVRTQAGADRLADRLAARGVPAQALHGGMSQAVRTRTLKNFRDGRTPALVATNVAARGIHVDGISLVVHVDAPADPKDYLHRAGRTARAGEAGTVVTLVSPRQQREVARMTTKAGVSPKVQRIRPMDEHLVAVTGAREPSGIAWSPAPATPAAKATGVRPRSTQGRPGEGRSTGRPRRPVRGKQDRRPGSSAGPVRGRSGPRNAGRSRPTGR